MIVDGKSWRTVWDEGDASRLPVKMIDQQLLPWRFEVVTLPGWRDSASAIRDMTVRGAGAIGAAAGYAMAQGVVEAEDTSFDADVAAAAAGIRATRPTARNLFAAVEVVLAAIAGLAPADARAAAVAAARAFADDDAACGEAIGRHGAPLIADGARVSTHCNAGWLAFVDWGSALAPVYAASRAGKRAFVWADETRPRGQGARLTAWELGQEGIPHAVLSDGAIGARMRRGEVDLCIVGADRIAANGDVANKIGTYTLATLAKAHGIPFYVAAPTTTIDVDCPDGHHIPIEERDEAEVTHVTGPDAAGALVTVRVVAPGSSARNEAFDVTPAALITGLITERGIVPATIAGIGSVARPRAR